MGTISLRLGAGFVLILTALTVGVLHADEKATPDPVAELQRADQFFVAGNFVEAEESYRTLLAAHPTLISAQAGLVRSLLRHQNVDEASELINKYLVGQPDSSLLLAAKGDVLFRRGEISAAEKTYLDVINLDSKQFYAHLGLARVYDASFLFGKSYEHLRLAHEIAPENVEVRLAWLRILPPKDRLFELEQYLLRPHPEDPRLNTLLWDGLLFLRATADKRPHLCKRADNVNNAVVALEFVSRPGQPLSGVGTTVQVQGRRIQMLLDTGGNGIVMSRDLAESMGLKYISNQHLGGLGDEGLQPGSLVVADNIQVGDLKFEDCYIYLIDKGRLIDDGVIGTNFFAAYLLDLDIPEMRLKLSELPQRPNDDWELGWLTNPSTPQKLQVSIPMRALDPVPSQSQSYVFRDRYVAPEMADWIGLFHVGNTLLVPTKVDDFGEALFELDTGAAVGVLASRLAHPAGNPKANHPAHLRGLSGESKKVLATEATLSFGGLPPWTGQLVAVDLRSQIPPLGPEYSGIIGFPTLRSLEIKLDYRDGLVQFLYDPDPTHTAPAQTSTPGPFPSFPKQGSTQ
jgi:tetratricopeptide (TPR) repeat protein